LCLGDDISGTLRRWRDFMPDAPDKLKWNLNLRIAPNTENVPADSRGRPVASESVLWVGDPEEGRAYLDHVLSPAVNRKVLSYLALQTMADNEFPHGRHYYTKSGYFKSLDDSSIDDSDRAGLPGRSSGAGRRWRNGIRGPQFALRRQSAGQLVRCLGGRRERRVDSQSVQSASAIHDSGSLRQLHEWRRGRPRA